MTTEKTLNGECLCGDISWKMNGPYEFFGMCQCSRCRKITGAAFATNLFVKPEQFSWLSGENKRGVFALPSPNTFGNAFCQNCGSRVPRQTPKGWMLLPLGSSMESPSIKPTLVCPEDHTEWFTRLKEIV